MFIAKRASGLWSVDMDLLLKNPLRNVMRSNACDVQ